MLDAVVALVDDLRVAGVPVSTGEALDAARAVTTAGLRDRAVLRAALQCALIKRPEHLTLFASLFDARFSVSGALSTPDQELSDEDLRDLLVQGLDGDQALLREAAREAVVRFGGLVPGRFLGAEYHVRRTMRKVEMAALAVGAGDDLDASLSPLEADQRQQRLERELSGEVYRHVASRRSEEWMRDEVMRMRPERLDFLRVTPDEAAELRRAAHSLGRKLAARLRIRGAGRQGGRLHVGATVRRSLTTGGVPFDPVFRRPRPHRPDVVVLADVSGSVATFARFTLQLVHALSGQFRQLRTFVFVDEIDEVTQWFRRGDDFDTAIAHIDARVRTTGEQGHSDYGRVLETFWSRWGTDLQSTTTVFVLGDARNNYHPANAGVLRDIAGRSRHLYWLNPEPAPYWDTADSVMGLYGSACDRVFECRNLDQLSNAIEQLS